MLLKAIISICKFIIGLIIPLPNKKKEVKTQKKNDGGIQDSHLKIVQDSHLKIVQEPNLTDDPQPVLKINRLDDILSLTKELFLCEKIKRRDPYSFNKIILHCSDYQKPHSAFDIHDWHLKRKWAGMGYHYFINFDGRITMGRRLHWVGSHCKGFNSKSLGICLAGKTDFTQQQANSLQELLNALKRQGYNVKNIKGHNFYNKFKTCPNFSVKYFLKHKKLIVI